MKHIHNKLVLWFIVVSIFPTMFIGIFSYFKSTQSLQNKLNKASLSTLEQINKNMDEKVQKVEMYLDVFFTSEKIQKVLHEVDFKNTLPEMSIWHTISLIP
ncbi:MAG: hypothetical protein HPY74_17390 [Firmicutes bacterium]|nr:hypothetical protein [Bacillota bacterium]